MFYTQGIYDKVISTLEDPRLWDTRGVKISALRAGIWHTRERHPRVYPWHTGNPPNTGPYPSTRKRATKVHPNRLRVCQLGPRGGALAKCGPLISNVLRTDCTKGNQYSSSDIVKKFNFPLHSEKMKNI